MALVSKAGSMYIICHVYRPGGLVFVTELEHRYYAPDSPTNDLINIYNVTYEGGMHYVVEIPAGKQNYDQATELATECNLKLVPGKPFNGTTEFPMKCVADKCFVLETLDHSSSSSIIDEVRRLKDKYSGDT